MERERVSGTAVQSQRQRQCNIIDPHHNNYFYLQCCHFANVVIFATLSLGCNAMAIQMKYCRCKKAHAIPAMARRVASVHG